MNKMRAVAVAQLVEWSLATPEVQHWDVFSTDIFSMDILLTDIFLTSNKVDTFSTNK